ncbi:hypothetical protein ACFWWM_37955 [Streptomyces sp. NPDC058682]|nr:hypothetical protein [Streptomyces sp. NBC_01214]MCX4808566.1 hypothetical protein [Streptomyces sp. NBC_01214]
MTQNQATNDAPPALAGSKAVDPKGGAGGLIVFERDDGSAGPI